MKSPIKNNSLIITKLKSIPVQRYIPHSVIAIIYLSYFIIFIAKYEHAPLNKKLPLTDVSTNSMSLVYALIYTASPFILMIITTYCIKFAARFVRNLLFLRSKKNIVIKHREPLFERGILLNAIILLLFLLCFLVLVIAFK